MDVSAFQNLISVLTEELSGKPVDAALETYLNTSHGVGSQTFIALAAACATGVKEGWMCQREGGGIRYGRVIKPSDATHGFSVDVVDMEDIAGPHHTHPQGEIDLIMPLTDGALFDGHAAGWCVYAADSSHRPTVSQGRALVLYLLPQGAIQFTAAT
ncbi:DUF4863 family protein [Herbaspirillum sp. RTI4]|uniref:4-hydroxylaminobenzoate lyase n=1 Tax=Herbaspirillum sp. RTI4 TaxID=3048640 RepID=UPI002AB41F4D|nr:DUF4863 family protein [Herbaspirillum sp. RTI4]MDY7578414.1 DUF4863 family protein [Herbaspirillum sp. RTI4]MEA9982572.1 DUF4863 family protein [Herbaspirillum sp. RTI4]